ncbi:hypothetical protein LR48_Vigan05g071900 [Vigna angularis]|uniref:Uncharacterized protein n=1 Tax=Phaseolus angularis TaxID=3914 RepID=A0A0L9UJR2_PHAAN|nr:hypothetical protein LR48_Vigan05g071900 [Vigna angularis]
MPRLRWNRSPRGLLPRLSQKPMPKALPCCPCSNQLIDNYTASVISRTEAESFQSFLRFRISTASAQPPVKSQPLHKFALPFLKWGASGKNHHTNAAHHHRYRRPSSYPSDHASEPDSDLDSRPHRLGSRTNRNRFALPTCSLKPLAPPPQPLQAPSCNDETNDEAVKRDIEDAEEAVQKPWNLRPRKPALPKPALEIGTGPSRNHANNSAGEFHDAVSNHGENPAPKSLRLRGFADTQCAKKKEKRKFWITHASSNSFWCLCLLHLVSTVVCLCRLLCRTQTQSFYQA